MFEGGDGWGAAEGRRGAGELYVGGWAVLAGILLMGAACQGFALRRRCGVSCVFPGDSGKFSW